MFKSSSNKFFLNFCSENSFPSNLYFNIFQPTENLPQTDTLKSSVKKKINHSFNLNKFTHTHTHSYPQTKQKFFISLSSPKNLNYHCCLRKCHLHFDISSLICRLTFNRIHKQSHIHSDKQTNKQTSSHIHTIQQIYSLNLSGCEIHENVLKKQILNNIQLFFIFSKH